MSAFDLSGKVAIITGGNTDLDQIKNMQLS